MTSAFEQASRERAAAMADACTRCRKCVEVCPVTGPGGIAAPPEQVIGGLIDLMRGGAGSPPARRWADSCMLTGECIRACPEGLNPRFMLAMARVVSARERDEPKVQRRRGVEDFRKVAQDVQVLSRMQLTSDMLARLGQRTSAGDAVAGEAERPDFVFYTGCNVLKTPHIALLALDLMDALGVTYRVMGGPTHCCGVVQFRTGDLDASGRMAEATLARLAQGRNGQVLSWCASCHVQFTETTLPAYERITGTRPFEMTPFMLFLRARLDQLRPLLRERVEMRVALHRHPGVAGVVEAAVEILTAIPGVQLVDLNQPSVGLQSVNVSVLPAYKRELQRAELDAARQARLDALVAVYHSDHRELCAHERDQPFRILNILEVIGESMGLSQHDRYKELKITQDADLIMRECGDLISAHALDAALARMVVMKALLGDQPLPLAKAT